jgi:hypothetical protein
MAVVFAPAGQLLHERGLHRLPLQEGTALVIEPVDETEKIGIGIDQDDIFIKGKWLSLGLMEPRRMMAIRRLDWGIFIKGKWLSLGLMEPRK